MPGSHSEREGDSDAEAHRPGRHRSHGGRDADHDGDGAGRGHDGAREGRDQALGLTRRELEVVRHAATGLTDRAIAERLVVSVRTVESHLAAAYRKLAINSRQGLAGLFA
jgi:DNA-binding NarL/FixJ family response regulator